MQHNEDYQTISNVGEEINLINSKRLYSSEEKLKWWDEGEWVEEIDEIEFTYKNFDCRIKRIHFLDGPKQDYHFGGYLCGYIRIPKGNWYDGDTDNCYVLDVHGLISYAEYEDKNFWIGFDCAHSYDYIPSLEKFKKTDPNLKKYQKDMQKIYQKNHILFKRPYRNIEYCISECKSLVDQVINNNKE